MSRAPTGAPWALGGVLLVATLGCSSAPVGTSGPASVASSASTSTTRVSTGTTTTDVGATAPRVVVSAPATAGSAPPAPTATAPATVASPPPATVASGPRMLLVELSSHPNGGWCPLVGVLALLQFSFQAADTYLVLVKNANGDVLASLPPNTTFTLPHMCAQMPVLYQFFPLAADGTVGPPWNFNV